MKNKIFNKFVAGLISILLLTTVIIKIYSILAFPKIRDWNYSNLQKIDKTKNEFSFAVFGDNKNSITTFKSLINKLNEENILFAVDAGDLVYDGEKEKFRFFIKQLENLNKPLLTAIGNHELKEGGLTNYYELFGRFYYSFTVGDSYFIILDDANENDIDPFQMDWLKEELKRSQEYKYRFIFMHVPLFDPRETHQPGHSMQNVKFAEELNRLFDEYNITMLFTSHIHGYYGGIWGKTPYIITGGAGAEMVGSDPRHYFYHYIKVKITSSGVKYHVVKIKSPNFDLIGWLAHDAWIYVDSFFVIHFIDSILMLSFGYLLFFISAGFIEKKRKA